MALGGPMSGEEEVGSGGHQGGSTAMIVGAFDVVKWGGTNLI